VAFAKALWFNFGNSQNIPRCLLTCLFLCSHENVPLGISLALLSQRWQTKQSTLWPTVTDAWNTTVLPKLEKMTKVNLILLCWDSGGLQCLWRSKAVLLQTISRWALSPPILNIKTTNPQESTFLQSLITVTYWMIWMLKMRVWAGLGNIRSWLENWDG